MNNVLTIMAMVVYFTFMVSGIASSEYLKEKLYVFATLGTREGEVFFERAIIPSFSEKNHTYVIDYDGNVIISDSRNGKIEKYSPMNKNIFSLRVNNAINADAEIWPGELAFDRNNYVYAGLSYFGEKGDNKNIIRISKHGKMVNAFFNQIPSGLYVNKNEILLVKVEKQLYYCDLNGNIKKSEKYLDLLGRETYDFENNKYSWGSVYDPKGNVLNKINGPKDKYEYMIPPPADSPYVDPRHGPIVILYGKMQADPYGNIYIEAYTKDKYKIFKWKRITYEAQEQQKYYPA
ncbi:MAG: hypothetical protein ABII23_02520, partial [bacterium]